MEARSRDADADVQRREDASNVGRHVSRRRHPRRHHRRIGGQKGRRKFLQSLSGIDP